MDVDSETSDPFPIDPETTTDCFWDAVALIETESKQKKSQSAPNATAQTHKTTNQQNNAHKLPLSNRTKQSHNQNNISNRNRNPPNSNSNYKNKPNLKNHTRPRTHSNSSNSSNASNSSHNKRRKFKPPKPTGTNTTYAKDYNQYRKKSKSPQKSHTNTNNTVITHTKPNKIMPTKSKPKHRQRMPLHLGHATLHSSQISTKTVNIPITNGNGTQHSYTNHNGFNGNNNNKNQRKPRNIPTISMHSHSNGLTLKPSKPILQRSKQSSNHINGTPPHAYSTNTSSVRSNNMFSASCTADSISRINLSPPKSIRNTRTNNDGVMFPKPTTSLRSQKPNKYTQNSNNTQRTNVSQSSKSDCDPTQKMISVKRDMAKLRRESRKNEQRLRDDVETYKRRAIDQSNEVRKLKTKMKEMQNNSNDKYGKQFQRVRSQLKDTEKQRNASESQLKQSIAENKALMARYTQERANRKTVESEYKKVHNVRERNKQLTQQIAAMKRERDININVSQCSASNSMINTPVQQCNSVGSQSVPLKKGGRKRKATETKLSETKQPKKRMKLSDDTLELEVKEEESSVTDLMGLSMGSVCTLYGRGCEFKSKGQLLTFEMERVSNILIDIMSGDPLDYLGQFIQTLSVEQSKDITAGVQSEFMSGYQRINEQRQKWQQLLTENWFLSQQTKSLIPLIRFLYQLLSKCDFNHILPMLHGIKILHIIFEGNDGKMYRNLLFDSITQAKKGNKKRKKSHKKRKKHKRKSMGFIDEMIHKNGLSHFLGVEAKKCENEQTNDIEMKGGNNTNKSEMDSDSPKRERSTHNLNSATLPDITGVIMDLLQTIQNCIFNNNESIENSKRECSDTDTEMMCDINKNINNKNHKKIVRPRVLICSLEDLRNKQCNASLLQYHCLRLFHKMFYYSMAYINGGINVILAKMILKRFKLIIQILLSKTALLLTKIVCIKIIILLFDIENGGINDKICQIFCAKNSLIARRMDKGNGSDEEPTLLHYCIESLFCISRFDLFGIKHKNDVLSAYLNINSFRQQIIRLISKLVCSTNGNQIFQRKIVSYSFNFKYESLKVIDNRVKSKVQNCKKSFLYLLAQLIIYENQTRNDHETEGMCYQFKHHCIDTKYAHLKEECQRKVQKMIDFAIKNKANKNNSEQKIDEINREWGLQLAKTEERSKDSKAELSQSDLSAETKQTLNAYTENVLFEDSYLLLDISSNHTKFGVLQKERNILIDMCFKLMVMFVRFMSQEAVRHCLKSVEFEIMKLLKDYSESGNEMGKSLFYKLKEEIHVFSDIIVVDNDE